MVGYPLVNLGADIGGGGGVARDPAGQPKPLSLVFISRSNRKDISLQNKITAITSHILKVSTHIASLQCVYTV